MPMSKAARVKALPLDTTWLADKAPAASRFEPSMMAQWLAVPLPVTVPSDTEPVVTLRPLGARAPGEPTEKEVLFPSEVEMAFALVVGSDVQMCSTLLLALVRTDRPLSSTLSCKYGMMPSLLWFGKTIGGNIATGNTDQD